MFMERTSNVAVGCHLQVSFTSKGIDAVAELVHKISLSSDSSSSTVHGVSIDPVDWDIAATFAERTAIATLSPEASPVTTLDELEAVVEAAIALARDAADKGGNDDVCRSLLAAVAAIPPSSSRAQSACEGAERDLDAAGNLLQELENII
jgi:hypothetical protein